MTYITASKTLLLDNMFWHKPRAALSTFFSHPFVPGGQWWGALSSLSIALNSQYIAMNNASLLARSQWTKYLENVHNYMDALDLMAPNSVACIYLAMRYSVRRMFFCHFYFKKKNPSTYLAVSSTGLMRSCWEGMDQVFLFFAVVFVNTPTSWGKSVTVCDHLIYSSLNHRCYV